MRLEQSFEVPVPVARAWSVLLDLERVAPCMPGATLASFDGTAFAGTVKVKLGPISLAYKGTGRFTERDEAGRRLAFVAQGQDSRGAGGASARVTAVLHDSGGSSTLVKVVADLDIAGRAAQFGRGMIADVSGKLVKQFADCLAETIAASAPAAAPASTVDAMSPVAPPPLTPVFAEPPPPPPVVAEPVFAESTPPPPPPVLAPVAEVPPAPVAPVFPAPPADWQPPTAPPAEPAPAAWTPPPAEEPAPVAWTPPPAEEPAPVAWTPPPLLEEYAAPTPAYSAPPPPPEPPAVPEASGAVAPPTPIPPVIPTQVPASPPATGGLRQPPVEAEPIDLLAVSGAKGALRRAVPVLIIVGLALVGLVVWLLAR